MLGVINRMVKKFNYKLLLMVVLMFVGLVVIVY